MNEPVWVLKKTILAIHEEQLSEHGGEGGLRDEGLLDSALSRPKNIYSYKKPDLFELAGAYAFGIIQNLPFVDGNKRTALVTSFLFLMLNGHSITAIREERVTMFIKLSSKQISEHELSAWLRNNQQKIIIHFPG